MTRLLLTALLVALPGLLIACEPEPDVEPGACVEDGLEPKLTLGHGTTEMEFVPVTEDDVLDVSFGPSGQLMVVVSLKLEGVDARRDGRDWETTGELEPGEVYLALLEVDEPVAGFQGVVFEAEDLDEEPLFLFNFRLVFSVDVDALEGTPLLLTARVNDGCYGDVEATRDVTVVH